MHCAGAGWHGSRYEGAGIKAKNHALSLTAASMLSGGPTQPQHDELHIYHHAAHSYVCGCLFKWMQLACSRPSFRWVATAGTDSYA